MGCGALSLPLKGMTVNTPTSLVVEVEIVWKADSQEELGVAADNGPDQRVPVRGLLRDRLAECERVAAGFVGGEVEMVGSDCRYSPLISAPLAVHCTRKGRNTRRGLTTNGRPASPHSFHSRCGGTMLELRHPESVNYLRKSSEDTVPRCAAVGTAHGAF